MGVPKTFACAATAAFLLSISHHTTTAAGSDDETLAKGSATPGTEAALGQDQSIRHRFERLPAHDLKLFYLRCAQVATEVRLTAGEAATCSIGYDVLLKRLFAGDFEALLAWSKGAAPPMSATRGDKAPSSPQLLQGRP